MKKWGWCLIIVWLLFSSVAYAEQEQQPKTTWPIAFYLDWRKVKKGRLSLRSRPLWKMMRSLIGWRKKQK
ncbi:hypothetical protein [Brevibacillus thermoruber]|uniref:hypothetical protein n=1 Tax=Brevibacillus thermoruber TaxID=33942 RepID=UPI0012E01AC9|nr:hypothetical protein [Brevibacillus thermoruber]